MKKPIFLIVFVILSSCDGVVYFGLPQPGNNDPLKTVPDKLIGKWIDEDKAGEADTFYMTKYGQIKIVVEKDSLGKINISRINHLLSDSLILKKSGKYYVVNYAREGRWHIPYIIKKETNGDISFYNPNHYPYFGEREGLEAELIISNNDTVYKNSIYDIKIPDFAVFAILQANYIGELSPTDIKKMILPQNIDYILKHNGSVENHKK